MRPFLPLLLTIAFLLTACGGDPASVPLPQEDSPSAEEVARAYEEAATLYDYFTLCSPPCTGEPVALDGNSYRLVDIEGLGTYADLEAAVNASFAPPLAREILNGSENFRDIQGRLYCAEGARGSNIFLFGKTEDVHQKDPHHFTVELRFWVDQEEPAQHLDPSGFPANAALITTGYSSEVLSYERTDEGFRFTEFCPSDALDLDADTVFSYNPQELSASGEHGDFTDWQLLCYLLHADGAAAKGVACELLQRFLERPQEILEQLTILYESPFYGDPAYPQAQYLAILPAYEAFERLSTHEQRDFLSALAACRPETRAQESLLALMTSRFQGLSAAEAPAPNQSFNP